MAELNDKLQWVYTVYLLGGVARHADMRRGVLCESFSIDGEDVTSAVMALERRRLVKPSTLKSTPTPKLLTEINNAISKHMVPNHIRRKRTP